MSNSWSSNQLHYFLPPELINTTVGEYSLRLWPADAGFPPTRSENCQSRPKPLPAKCRTHIARAKQSWGTHPRHVPYRVPSQVFVGEQRSSCRHWWTACQISTGGRDPIGALWTNPNCILRTEWFLFIVSDMDSCLILCNRMIVISVHP